MSKKDKLTTAFIILLIALAALFWLGPTHKWPVGNRTTGFLGKLQSSSAKEVAANASTQLDEFRDRLSKSDSPDTSRQYLSDLRKFLDSISPEIASSVIQSFLATNKDASTKLGVTIRPGGNLGDASSLRVFLLDYLGQIDRAAAGTVAMDILSRYTTADEWAVSLRNFARANPDAAGYGYLQLKARELLSNTDWRKNPSAGYLEAFDTIVYAHATDLTPELTALVRDKDNRATAHAAYLTLDRLTISETTAMLTQLVQQPALMAGHEQTRANLVARADIRQPDQLALVEQYLLDQHRTPEELNTFAAIYPNANYMISENLLTKVHTPGAKELSAHDREALRLIDQWQTDPRFQRLQLVLAKMHERLRSFVQQTQAGDSQN